MQLLVTQMNGIVACVPDSHSTTLGLTPMSARNRTALRRVDFFGRQPGRVLERLTNVLFLEIRMIAKHLLDSSSMRDLPYDHRNGMRMPRMHARPPMMFGSKVMPSNMTFGF